MAQAHPAPLTVRLAGAVQAAEAVLLLAATVLAAVDTAAGKSYQAASGIALTVIGLLTVGLLLLIALGLARARQWTRTPALMTQLLDRKSTRLNSSHVEISYAVFCLKKKKKKNKNNS